MDVWHGGTNVLQTAIDAVTAANAAQAAHNMQQVAALVTQMGEQQQALVASLMGAQQQQTAALVDSMITAVGRLRPLHPPPARPDAAPIYGGGPAMPWHGKSDDGHQQPPSPWHQQPPSP